MHTGAGDALDCWPRRAAGLVHQIDATPSGAVGFRDTTKRGAPTTVLTLTMTPTAATTEVTGTGTGG
jgi:hypothetical protein